MNNKLTKLKLVALFMGTFCLCGCDSTIKAYNDTNKAVDLVKKDVETIKVKQNNNPSVAVQSGIYVDAAPIDLTEPAWFQKRIKFVANRMPLSFVINKVLRGTPAILNVPRNLPMDIPVTLNYSGTVKGALDNLALLADYSYSTIGNQLIWSDFETKTIDISFMPGTSDYSVGRTSASSSSSSSSGSSHGSDLQTVSSLDDDQYANFKGTMSVWKDLERTLNELKSPDGTIAISESSTSLVVRDRPSNVRVIENYVTNLNKELSREVELKVKVVEVALDKEHSYGIDWQGVNSHLFDNNSISAISNFAEFSNISDSTAGLLKINVGGNSNVVLNALGTQGKLSMVTEPTIMTLNNQVAEVRITRDTSYLEKAETSALNINSSSSSITPGVVTDGFTLYVLPKIQDGKIFLNVSSTFSTLQKLDTINNLGGINQNVKSSEARDQNIVTIQVPTLNEKRFNLKSLLQNNETLVIAGFKQVQNQTTQASLLDIAPLGSRGSKNNNIETVILITPTIVTDNK